MVDTRIIHGQVVGKCLLAMCLLLLTACASQPFQPYAFDTKQLERQAVTKKREKVSVTAAVPGAEQSQQIFGVDLYKHGIQPVWLRIENDHDTPIRYAPTGTDREYFSPLEVAYMFRGDYAKASRSEMEKFFYRHAMPRRIAAGDHAEGFIFTRRTRGTKNLFVDTFGQDHYDESFAFFLPVKGFRPDHAEIDFHSIYAPEEVIDVELAAFRVLLRDLPCCSNDMNGQPVGLPITLAIVGTGEQVLRALLRAGWQETEWVNNRDEVDEKTAHFLFGRLPDAVFRSLRNGKNERNEAHIWLTPWRVEGKNVWAFMVTHFIGQRNQFRQALFGAAFDPDLDDARNYFAQNLWYTQVLERSGWVKVANPVIIEESKVDHTGAPWFSDGYRLALWLTDENIPMNKSETLPWDPPPKASR